MIKLSRKKTSNPPKEPYAKRRKRRGKGVLALIGGLMIASAMVRIATGAASALENAAPGTQGEADHAGGVASHDPASMSCGAEDDIAPILEALSLREERVTSRENDLRVRIQALRVAENEIDRKLAAMQSAEEKLRATLAMADSAAEDDVDRLTQVYATMKPKQAAALFEEMDPEFAAGFLARMRPESAAAIMAGIAPSTAYTISVMLAGRNAGAPKQ